MNHGAGTPKRTRILYLILAACVLLSVLPVALFSFAEPAAEGQGAAGLGLATPTDMAQAGQEAAAQGAAGTQGTADVPGVPEPNGTAGTQSAADTQGAAAPATPTDVSPNPGEEPLSAPGEEEELIELEAEAFLFDPPAMSYFTMNTSSIWSTLPYYGLQVLGQNPTGLRSMLMDLLDRTRNDGAGQIGTDTETGAILTMLHTIISYSGWSGQSFPDFRFDYFQTADPQARYENNRRVLDAWLDYALILFEDGKTHDNVAYIAPDRIDMLDYLSGNAGMDGIYVNGDMLYMVDRGYGSSMLEYPLRLSGDLYDGGALSIRGDVYPYTQAAEDPATDLRALARDLAAHTLGYARGDVTVAGDVCLLSGSTLGGVVVFDLPLEAAQNPACRLQAVNGLPDADLYVINIPGDNLYYSGVNWDFPAFDKLLLNFYEAETIVMGANARLPHVLAPKAELAVNGSLEMYGNVVVNTLVQPVGHLVLYGQYGNLAFPEYQELRIKKHCQDTATDFTFRLMQEHPTYGTPVPLPAVTYYIGEDEHKTTTDGEFTLRGGETAVFQLIPGTYYVYEEPSDWYDYVTKIKLDGTLVPEAEWMTDGTRIGCEVTYSTAGAPILVDFYNLRNSGITVEKELDDAIVESHADTAFRFRLLNSAGNPEIRSFTDQTTGWFTLKGGEKVAFDDLPAGNYTLEEEETGDTLPVFSGASSVESQTDQSITFRVDAKTEEDIVVTNEPTEVGPKYNDIYVKKMVSSDDNADYRKEYAFTLTLTGDDAPATLTYTIGAQGAEQTVANGGTFYLKHNETAIFTNLLVGLHYVVAEQADGYDQEWSGHPRSGILPDPENWKEAWQVLCTNTPKEEEPETNTIRVTKQVNSENAEDLAGAYHFALVLTGDDAPATLTYHLEGAVDERVVGNGRYFALMHGETAVFENIPVGLTYAVMEYERQYTQAWTGSDRYGIVPAPGEDIAIVCTNTPKEEEEPETNTIRVEKQVNSENAADLEREFAFTILLSGDDAPETLTYTVGGESRPVANGGAFYLKHGEAAVFEYIPVGLDYFIAEHVDGFDQLWTGDSSTGTVPAQEEQSEGVRITCTNTPKEPETNTIRIEKQVTSGDALERVKEFAFELTLTGENAPETLTYTINGAEKTVANGAQFPLKHGEIAVFADIPVGLSYAVVERAANYIQAWTGAPRTGTVPAQDDPGDAISIICTNTNCPPANERSIRLEKKVRGTDADKEKVFGFTITLSGENAPETLEYERNGTGNTYTMKNGGKVYLGHGEYILISYLPENVTYTVEEDETEFIREWAGAQNTGTIGTESQQIELLCINTTPICPVVPVPETGTLSVEKMVNSSRSADKERFFTFTLTVTGEYAPASLLYAIDGGTSQVLENGGTFTLKHGETAQFSGLYAGLSYTVTETAAGFTQAWSGAARTGTIAADTNHAIRCTNTRQTTPAPTPRPTLRPSPTPRPNNPGFVPSGPEPIPLGNVPGTEELLEDDIPLGMPETGSTASYATLLIALLALTVVALASLKLAKKL